MKSVCPGGAFHHWTFNSEQGSILYPWFFKLPCVDALHLAEFQRLGYVNYKVIQSFGSQAYI